MPSNILSTEFVNKVVDKYLYFYIIYFLILSVADCSYFSQLKNISKINILKDL